MGENSLNPGAFLAPGGAFTIRGVVPGTLDVQQGTHRNPEVLDPWKHSAWAVTTPRVQLVLPGSEFQGWVQTHVPKACRGCLGKAAGKDTRQVPRARVYLHFREADRSSIRAGIEIE